MKRRDFVRSVALAGATAGIAHAAKLFAAMPSQLDTSDRSPDRDPMAILRSTLVVDGYSGGPMNEEYIKKLRSAEVHCKLGRGHSRFPEDMALATTVKEIREIHKQGKIAQIFKPGRARPGRSASPAVRRSTPPPWPTSTRRGCGSAASATTWPMCTAEDVSSPTSA